LDPIESDEHEESHQAAVSASHQQWLGVRQA
jgi:hypothetical protein